MDDKIRLNEVLRKVNIKQKSSYALKEKVEVKKRILRTSTRKDFRCTPTCKHICRKFPRRGIE